MQVTINSINKAQIFNKRNKYFSISNRILIVNIIELIRKKNINLVLKKVKVHIDIQKNKEVDKLAKEELGILENLIDLLPEAFNIIHIVPK